MSVSEKQVGPSTYRLADGRVWHSSHLSLVPEALKPTSEQSAVDASVENVPNTEQSTERRSARQCKPPIWLQDYETNQEWLYVGIEQMEIEYSHVIIL